jgi:hypothetical protein
VTFNDETLTSRQLMGVGEDKFVVGMNAANKGVCLFRKAFGENILAFSMFAQKYEMLFCICILRLLVHLVELS